ncbi:MAG TPA: hypothetical protein VGL38_07790 [bacterium]
MPSSTLDAAASKIIADKSELRSVLAQIQAAKRAGQRPGSDLYRRLQDMVPASPRRGGHLDQGGEACASAAVIPSVPYSDFGTTTGYQDNLPECDGSGNAPDVVYSFTPSVSGDYHISLCGSSYDTKLFVYEGTCTGTPIACNDDGVACGDVSSDLPRVTLNGGTTYYIIVDGWDGSFGDYAFLLEEVAPPPTGDVCADPIVIPSLPFSVENAWTCGFNNDYSGSTCLGSADSGPDVVYTFTLTTASSVEIILNAHPSTTPPMEQYVWPGVLLSDHCPPDWNCLASASNMTADLLYLPCQALQAGTYYVVVDNANMFQACYSYDLTIRNCGPCTVTSHPGDVAEVTEPFPVPGTFSVNDPNGGCNNASPYLPRYQTVTSGETVYGRTFFYTDSITGSLKADTDWYRLLVTTPSTVTCTYAGESLLRIAIIQPPCPGVIVLNGVPSTPCNAGTISSCMEPGEYYIRISRGGPQTGPDAQTFAYRASFSLTPCQLPLGRCCYSGTCATNTHPECVALTGTWFAGLTCDTPCPVIPPNDNCQNAGTPASLPATFTGNNINATNDCPLYEGDPQVWHVFTTTEAQDIQVDYCGTQNFHSFNPYLYQGCPCGSRVMLDLVDWGLCSPTAMTGIWRNLPAGTWYISVTLYNPNSIGDYTIHVNSIPSGPPANDECTAATPITLVPNGQVTVTGSTINATVSCSNICNEGGFDYTSSGGDVFYSLTLTECRRIAMALGIGDMHIAVYQGVAQCCTGPALLCNDDDAHFLPLPAWDVPAQHPGESRSYVAASLNPGVYLIRVAKYASQSGAYTLTVYDNGPCCLPPAANDVAVLRVNNTVDVRWSTDAASATRGTYRIYSNTNDMPVGDPSWTIVADNIVPVVGQHHPYYSAPFAADERRFYYVTGICNEAFTGTSTTSKP